MENPCGKSRRTSELREERVTWPSQIWNSVCKSASTRPRAWEWTSIGTPTNRLSAGSISAQTTWTLSLMALTSIIGSWLKDAHQLVCITCYGCSMNSISPVECPCHPMQIFLSISDCVTQYAGMVNKGADGATARSDLTTEDACLTFCSADLSCVGADIDTRTGNTLCWLFYSASRVQITKDVTGVNHYILTSRCSCMSSLSFTLNSDWFTSVFFEFINNFFFQMVSQPLLLHLLLPVSILDSLL